MHNPSPDAENRRAICVFCGSSHGVDKAYAETARRLGALIAAQGFSLVFGGGDLGLMGETARAVRAGGGKVRGVLPDFLKHLEPPMAGQEELFIAADLFQRKDRMIADGDAFVVLPGGLGTFDEFFEVVTSAQLGVHKKPIAVVNTNGFFDPLKALIDHTVAKGFVRKDASDLYKIVATPDEAIVFIQQALAAARASS
jgi:uncharacterized protein (TIGR00730 family)